MQSKIEFKISIYTKYKNFPLIYLSIETMYEERDTCWVSHASQGSEEWRRLRVGRITSSNISMCVGRSGFRVNKDELSQKILGSEEFEENAYMRHGIETEPLIRQWYAETLEQDIKEVGLAIWKKDYRFGGSLDGEFGTQGIEIKAPQKMYHKLVDFIEAKKKGYKFEQGYHDHIFNSHYDQMTCNGVITGKTNMHYVVICTDTQQGYLQRIPVDYDHWYNNLYPKAVKFYEEYIEPKLNGPDDITRIDP